MIDPILCVTRKLVITMVGEGKTAVGVKKDLGESPVGNFRGTDDSNDGLLKGCDRTNNLANFYSL